ncbi:MAG: TolC family protein [Elusimicrobiota bacterium]|nr:TolC family protein [Elusimicrobiota bacterium]
MNGKIIIFSIFSLIPLTARAAQVTLEAAVEKGLKADNILKEEAARVSGAKAGLSQARLARLGGFKLKGMYTDGTDPVYAFAAAMKQGTFSMASMAAINDPAPARNFTAGIEAGVPLFTGFAVTNAVKMGELGTEAAQSGYERARAGITFKITYQWLTVLLRRRLAELASDSVKAAETELKTARMLKDKGMVPGSDYYGAEAILSTLRGYSLSWDKALELEKEKLAITLGMDAASGVDAAGGLNEAVYAEKTRSELAAAPPGGRRDIKALEKMAAVSRISEAMQENSVLPVVEAFGSWETNSESLSNFRSSRLLGLRLTVPLGDPAYFAKRDAARAEASMASSRLDEARKQASIEVAEALNNYSAAKESLPVARETLEKARQSLELFRPLYRQGRQSVLEVLRAQASVLQAEAAYYETLYKLNLYHARTLLASETLDGAAIKEMSEKLVKTAN